MSTFDTIAAGKLTTGRSNGTRRPKHPALFGEVTFADITNPRKPQFIRVCLSIVTRHDGITRLSVEHVRNAHGAELQTVDRRNVELPSDVAAALIEAITG